MITKAKYSYFDTFLLRTPSFNFDSQEFAELNGKTLIDFFTNNQQFREAIYIASKDLYHEVDKSIANNTISEKLLNSLAKYFIRSKTRCTPFGLFSGFCTGSIGKSTNITLENTSKFEKYIRVDMEVVSVVTDYLLTFRDIVMSVKFTPNNTIHSIGSISSYIESQTINNNEKVCFKSTFEEDTYMSSILEYCKNGKLITEISQFLLKEYKIDSEEAEDFILELIKNKILCSELEISTIDTNPFETLIHKISKIDHIEDVNIQNFIKNGEALIDFFLKKDKNISIDDIELFKTAFNSFNFTSNNIFQIDLKGKVKINELSGKTIQDVNKSIDILNLFSHYQNNAFKEFKEAFYKKYEDEEVPLLRVLDDDSGFGYPVQQKKLLSDLLDEISFPPNKNTNKYKLFSQKDIFLLRKLSQFFLDTKATNALELNIDDADLSFFDNIDQDTQPLPNTLSALVELYKTQDNEEKVYVNMFSASATNLLGRFSSSDKKVKDCIREIYEKEKSMIGNDTIIAEIVHLPKYREGNVLLRPSFGTYEIPILSQSLLPDGQQIQLNDLYLSMKGNHLVLRSKKHNKYILPKLSSAHNYMNPQNLSLYRFLSDFQYQDEKKYMFFDWGAISEDFIFLPRIVYKNIILSKALWNFTIDDLTPLHSYSSDEELEEKIHSWRKKYRIPEQFALKDFDNKLFIDTKNIFMFKMFLNTVKNLKKIIIEETFYDNELVIKDEKGNSFTNEIILNFYKKHDK